MKTIFTLLYTICIIWAISEVTPTQAQTIYSVKPSFSFSVFPNPAVDEISIAIDNTTTGIQADLYIYNAVGDLVYSKSINVNEFQVPVKVDLRDYQRGMYVVQLTGADSKVSRKLLLK